MPEGFEFFYSEDHEHIIVRSEDGEEFYPKDEFIVIFGEEYLP